MARVAMETINGWKVEFDPETGSFYGTSPGMARGSETVLKRRDLAALHREISKRSMGKLEVMSISSLRAGAYQTAVTVPFKRVITGVEGNQVRQENGTLDDNWRTYARYDEAVVTRIQEFKDRLEAAKKAVLDEYNLYLRGLDLHSMTIDQIKAALAESTAAAEAAAPAS